MGESSAYFERVRRRREPFDLPQNHRQFVAQRLPRGPREVSGLGPAGQPRDGACRLRFVERCARSFGVGKQNDAGRPGSRFGVRDSGEAADPFEEFRARRCRGADAPGPGHERHSGDEAGNAHGAVGREKRRDGGAERDGHVAGAKRPGRHDLRVDVASAGHDGRPLWKSRCFGGRLRHGAEPVERPRERWNAFRVESGFREDSVGARAIGKVHEAGSRGARVIPSRDAGEPGRHEVVALEEAPGPRVDVGTFLLEPQDLRDDGVRRERTAEAFGEPVGADGAVEARGLVRRTAVDAVEDGVVDGTELRVDGDEGAAQGADAQRADIRERDARREIATQLDDAVPPGFGRGDLVPVFLRPEHAARDAGLRANPPLTVDDGRFQR